MPPGVSVQPIPREDDNNCHQQEDRGENKRISADEMYLKA